MSELLLCTTAAELRLHLDELNETGIGTTAAGVDANGEPFLVALVGPYAETEEVFVASPWDGEIDAGTGRRCDECSAYNPHRIDHLRYPVQVVF